MPTESTQVQAVILFVDDEPSILSALRRLFRPQGYRVLMAEGGAAGLALMEAEPVDLVISDMRMPEMDGVQFLEQVRQRWPEVMRILLTGYADIGSTIDAINRGEIHRYIAKPWDDQDILLSVSDCLARGRLERENAQLQALTHEQNAKLKDVNDQLQLAIDRLEDVNTELDARVQARTAELEHAVAQLNTANAQLEENFALSISVFSGLLELRDGSVAGHGHRVAELSRRMAQKLGLSPQEELDTYNAGLLHEIGKIGLPDDLMHKSESLMTADELHRYHSHPLLAQNALMPLGRLRQSAIIIRSYQERIDGQGFPDGLQGLEVPIGAQIVNLASTYESLIAGLISEKAHSTESAAKLIHEAAGTRYDAEVIAAFDQVLKELTLEALADQEIGVKELRSGMALSRPLLSPHGSVLLPTGFILTSAVVHQLQEFGKRNELELSLFIRVPTAPAKGRAALGPRA